MEMTERITEIVASGKYAYYGLRVVEDEPTLAIGSTLPPSRRWVDGDPTDDYLEGTSVIAITPCTGVSAALNLLRPYYGSYLLVVGYEEFEHGQDSGEAIAKWPVLLAVIDRIA